MDQTAKKAELAKYFMSQGIFAPDDQQAQIEKLAATYPAAKATEEGLTDVVDLAYAALVAQNQANAPKVTEGAPVQTQPTATVSDADKSFIHSKLRSEKPVRAQKTRGTRIAKLLLSKPAPADYIKAGTTGILKKEGFEAIQKKVADGTYVVQPDDPAGTENGVASTTNYNLFVAAMENPEAHPFEVYVGKLNTRPAGYLVNTLDKAGSNTTNQQFTRAEFEKFLILETEGFVMAASANAPGAMLRYIDPKSDPSDPGKVKPGRTVVVDKNKKEAIAAGNYEIVSQKTDKMKAATGKSALSFKVRVAGKTTAKGDPVIKTIRASLSIEIPEMECKAEYEEKFNQVKDTTFTEEPKGDAYNNIHNAQIKAIADLTKAITGSTDTSLDAYAEDIAKFMKPTSQAPTVAV